MQFNASQMRVWMTCALQAKFQYEDQLPRLQNAKASFGTCIHKALEQYNNDGNVQVAINSFKEWWAHPELLGVKPDVWPKYTTYNGLRERGIEILTEYHEKLKWDGRTVIATEHPFKVPFGDHELSGVVDLLELRRAGNGHLTLRVVDYKTNTKQPSFVMLRFDIQFTAYMYATEQPEFWTGHPGTKYVGIPDGENLYERLKKTKRKAIWYHLWTNKEIDAGERDDGDYERLYRLADEIDKAKEASLYIPTINADNCLYCPYTDQCRFVLPVKQQIALEEEGEEIED